MMQNSGDRPPETPDIESLRELLARLERCEKILPSAEQASEAASPSPPAKAAAATPPSRLRAWASKGTVAASFAAGFALALIALTFAMRPHLGDRVPVTAVQLADGKPAPAAGPASTSQSSAPSDQSGARKGTGTLAAAAPAPTDRQAAQAQPEAKSDDLPKPKLSVAGRLETEVGGTVPLAVALSEAPRADADVAMLVRGVPDDVALSPAWPMGSGVWFVNPVDAGKLRLTLYAAPRKDSQLSIELWSPDGSLIATANAVLVAPPRSADAPVAVVGPPVPAKPAQSQASVPPATVLASRPEPAQPDDLAAPSVVATPRAPVVGQSRDRAAAQGHRASRRAARRNAARAESRNMATSRRRQGEALATQSGLVWPGDAPRSTVRRGPPRRSEASIATGSPRPQPSSSWPTVAFGQSRSP